MVDSHTLLLYTTHFQPKCLPLPVTRVRQKIFWRNKMFSRVFLAAKSSSGVTTREASCAVFDRHEKARMLGRFAKVSHWRWGCMLDRYRRGSTPELGVGVYCSLSWTNSPPSSLCGRRRIAASPHHIHPDDFRVSTGLICWEVGSYISAAYTHSSQGGKISVWSVEGGARCIQAETVLGHTRSHSAPSARWVLEGVTL